MKALRFRVIRGALGAVVSAALLCLAAGCTPAAKTEGTGSPCACEGGATVVDQALVAFLSKARAAHLRADALEETDAASAIRSLQGIVDGPLPKEAPEVREVVADTRARLAELRTKRGELDEARADVKKGLLSVPEVSYFRGHLFEVLGFVEERQSEARAKAGDAVGAAEARTRAVEASEQAVTIQDEVIRRALEKKTP